ncbi:MAG: hypothetical protein CGU28_12830 [Candidatus Dactylopiibacterium carminicum]|uniref:CidA/LrgA family protein n=1 Tax=Candidatus Dactylopiibacterium carminicum TaxID=857335 RepID=A0A272EPF9_9RHOO|nr:CidA/LrgA family protein [Candidatus Dactylopiibacterium carminicum]KAF7599134.1 CidA/LrgA family protein [Candidatus Dactylopiibacterium carminicum]PAS91989.1 MAG: hypothetical protein CGU29_13515 [Candidatus Dactylopiibacterium carminicum]PAS95257.1 MAG: hypothetical protein CGU28_12830 [Candidatus Dactylopiibacterium carminicum]PAS99152.1 MAG: hypothetical protein BSR46_09605 [Candidatus Dactylopiibacterium carminicum]
MLKGCIALLACLVVGEIVVYLLTLPLPGAVVGMALALGLLVWRGGEPPAELREASQGLLQYLSLLFVPAGVGLILHLDRLRSEWLALSVAVVGGALLTIALSALLLQRLVRRGGRTDD